MPDVSCRLCRPQSHPKSSLLKLRLRSSRPIALGNHNIEKGLRQRMLWHRPRGDISELHYAMGVHGWKEALSRFLF
jgi:hypothetical protein